MCISDCSDIRNFLERISYFAETKSDDRDVSIRRSLGQIESGGIKV